MHILQGDRLSKEKTIHELKEVAKWSRDPQEMKTAIKELSARGDTALPALEEILNVTAYEDIKTACIEAIKSVKEEKREKEEGTVKKTKSEAQVEEEKKGTAGKTETATTAS